MASIPTIIVIPGSWHTTHHASPLVDVLKARGYNAQAHQLASVGLKQPRPTFADDVNTILNAVTCELDAGRDVCLVLHSYAGMPGAEAVNRLHADGRLEIVNGKAKLIRVVFLAAYIFPVGFVMDAAMFVGPSDSNFSIDKEGINHMAHPRTVFFNDIASDSEAQTWVDKLVPCYYLGKDPVLSSDDWKKAAPVTVVLTKRDGAIPSERQEMIWQGHEHVWLDAGHSPYIGHPEMVAKVVVKAIGGDVA